MNINAYHDLFTYINDNHIIFKQNSNKIIFKKVSQYILVSYDLTVCESGITYIARVNSLNLNFNFIEFTPVWNVDMCYELILFLPIRIIF